tara:strand:- start:159 stop:401 length:243 start_codon:yes stop_codon:yes gene_type:complete
VADIHSVLVLLLLIGGFAVEVQLARFLAYHRRLRERELDLLSQSATQDQMPSQMMEALHGFSSTTTGTGSPFNGGDHGSR